MKKDVGILLSSRRKMKGVWKEHSEHLMNAEAAGEAVMLHMGMEAGGKVFLQGQIEREEVK